MSQNKNILIAGAGITGLALAEFLRARGHSVTVAEKSAQAGGTIRSGARKGFWLEYGPNTFMFTDSGPDRQLVQMIDMESALISARPAANKRYIARRGRLHKLSPNLAALIKGGILDWRAVGRIGVEALRRRSNLPERPTVAEFFADRLGPTAVENLVGPFVSGIYAGDPAQLSVAHAFPRLFTAYQDRNSLIRGLLAMPKTGHGRPASYWFEGGLAALTNRLAQRCGDNLHLNAQLALDISGSKPVARLNGTSRAWDEIVLTVPLPEAAEILGGEGPTADAVPYGDVALIHVGFSETLTQLDGFGFLVSLSENTPLLGALFNSSSFPERAPNGGSLVTLFCGGLLRKRWLEQDDEQLILSALESFRYFTGVRQKPVLTEITRVSRAIPQYPVTHDQTLAQVDRLQHRHQGVHCVANWVSGISVPDRIRAAWNTAEKLG